VFSIPTTIMDTGLIKKTTSVFLFIQASIMLYWFIQIVISEYLDILFYLAALFILPCSVIPYWISYTLWKDNDNRGLLGLWIIITLFFFTRFLSLILLDAFFMTLNIIWIISILLCILVIIAPPRSESLTIDIQ
jgi:hypothetical protein